MVTTFPLSRAIAAADITEILVPVRSASTEFSAALRTSSNLASDWVWLAARLESRAERFACLQRALWIDPDYRPALEALAELM